jgi:hypothetical protein
VRLCVPVLQVPHDWVDAPLQGQTAFVHMIPLAQAF